MDAFDAFTRQGPLVRCQYRPPLKTKSYPTEAESPDSCMELGMELFARR